MLCVFQMDYYLLLLLFIDLFTTIYCFFLLVVPYSLFFMDTSEVPAPGEFA